MDKAVISVEIPAFLDDFLQAEARARLTSKSAVIREVLINHLNRQPKPAPAFPVEQSQPQKEAA